MSRASKIWLITAASLMLIGLIIFGGVMTMLNWDLSKLSTIKYETNTYEPTEKFDGISVYTVTAAVEIRPSEDGKVTVICREDEKARHSVSVKDGTLTVELKDERKWYDRIGINFSSPQITVYIPNVEYGTLKIKNTTGKISVLPDLKFNSIDVTVTTGDVKLLASAEGDVKVKTNTGDITVNNISAGSVDLAATTGKITASSVTSAGDFNIKVTTGKTCLTNVSCKSLTTSGSTGSITLTDVIAFESFNISRDTGNVKLEKCDASEIFIKTDTGNVKGSLLSEKVFIVNTDTGKKYVPKTVTGGRCEITTDTGDIIIKIAE